MNPPAKLFKYESWNEHSVTNLKNSQLYFSDPVFFNNPFDCFLDFRMAKLTEEEFEKIHTHFCKQVPDKRAFVKELGTARSKRFKSLIIPVIEKNSLKATREFLRNRGVSCFSATNNEILMWSHYSKSHTGYCLEFDTSLAPFCDAKKVQYKEDFPELNPIHVLIEHEKLDVAPLILTKHKSWEYEEEWRVLHSKTQVLFRYQPQALTGIYFGAKMPIAHCEIIASFVHIQSPHTVFYKAEKSKSKFRLEFKKMDVNFSGH